MTVGAIDEDTREGCKEERRRLPDETDQPQDEGGVGPGEAKHEPARGDAGHPRADERNGLAGEEEAVVPMRQCSAQSAERAGLFGARFGRHGCHPANGWAIQRSERA
jgi:hypothetical protein